MPLGIKRMTSLSYAPVADTGRDAATITVYGNTQIDTAQSKIGGSSILFDGSGDYLTANDIAIGTGDFTFECWVRLNVKAKRGILSIYDGSNDWYLLLDTNNDYGFLVYSPVMSPQVLDAKLGGTSYTNTNAGQWYHLAFTRSGTSVKLWLDGNLMESGTSSANFNGVVLNIGTENGNTYWNGWIDEIRVSSVARYTTTFTPPTSAFTNDSDTLLLLHGDGTDGSTTIEDDNS
jgi:hypothetical protein